MIRFLWAFVFIISCSNTSENSVSSSDDINKSKKNDQVKEAVVRFLKLTDVNIRNGKVIELEKYQTVSEKHREWFDKGNLKSAGSAREAYLSWVSCYRDMKYVRKGLFHAQNIGEIIITTDRMIPGILKVLTECDRKQRSYKSTDKSSLSLGSFGDSIEKNEFEKDNLFNSNGSDIYSIDAKKMIEDSLILNAEAYSATSGVGGSTGSKLWCDEYDTCEESHNAASLDSCVGSSKEDMESFGFSGWPYETDEAGEHKLSPGGLKYDLTYSMCEKPIQSEE